MKIPKLFVPVFLFLFSLTAFAQNAVAPKTDWKIFQPKGEEFTVTIPILLEPFVYDKNVTNRRFTASVDRRFLFVSSDLLTEPFHYKIFQELLKQIVYESKKERLNNFEVEKISFDYSDDFFHRMWIIKTEKRIYIFHTASEIENDEITHRFFESIKIDRKLVNDNTNTEFVFRGGFATSGSNAGHNQRNMLGISSDTGNSSNSGILEDSLKPVDLNNSPFQISSKPRANYTDFARFFDIQGSVNVRTTFLETGAVGDVSAITKLPFGLTKNALEAAKKIKFQPMVKNGNAISVTKTVQYTFTIY